MLLSRGPMLRRSPAEGRKRHKESHHGMRIPSATSLPPKSHLFLPCLTRAEGDNRDNTVIRCLGLWVRAF